MDSNSITLEAVRINSLSPLPTLKQNFDERGGCVRIGRNEDNDLVLADDEFVSGYHAKIVFENNRFLLSDTSTNGTGIGNRENLLHRDTVELKHGNSLIIGEYEILVGIYQDMPADQFDATPIDTSDNDKTQIETIAPLDEFEAEQNQTDFCWDNTDDASEYRPSAESETASSSRTTGSPENEPICPPAADRKTDNLEDVPDDIGDLLWPQEVTKPPIITKEMEPREDDTKPTPHGKTSNPTLEGASSDFLLKAFLEGAGLVDKVTEIDDPAATLQLAGSMLRVMVEEVKKLLYVRAKMKQEIGAEPTIMAFTGVSQLKFSVSVDQALELMLVSKQSGFLETLDSVKQGFRDIESHQQATIDATQVALEEILKRFAPEHYEDKFKEGFVFNRCKKVWNAYKGAYVNNVAQARQDIFGAGFGRAYDEKKRLLKELNQE